VTDVTGRARERAQAHPDEAPRPDGSPADTGPPAPPDDAVPAGDAGVPGPPDAPTVRLTAGGDPRPYGRHGTWLLIKRTLVRAWDDNIFSESAAAAFWQTLSLPPLLLGLLGSLGYIGGWFGPDTIDLAEQQILRGVSTVFSRNVVDEIIAPTVSTILTTGRSELVSLGFVISLWSGSSAMSSFVDAITRAHDQYGVRNPVWQRTLALLMYIVALIGGIVSLPLLALGPDRLPKLLPASWQDTAVTLIGWLYYPVLGFVLVFALTTLYKLALPAKPPWHRGLPGALLAAVVFLAGVTGLRVYISWLTTTGYTYGALAAPIAFLLAAFFIGFAIVLGAHFNAAVQHYWPKRLNDRRNVVPQPHLS
jgi:membrane protein